MYDFVIIGAGVAGALIADQLSLKGYQVALVEAGPNEQDRGLFLNNFLSSAEYDISTPYPQYEQVPQPRLKQPHFYYVQKGPELFFSPYNRRVGGTTWNWLGSTPRFVPNDFKIKSLYDQGEDWPLSYQDLLPWYEKAETALGVDHDFPQSCVDKWVNGKLQGKKYESQPLHFEPVPQARDRNRCCGASICVVICPTQAKYDATIHVNKAVKQGVHLITKAVVYKLHTDSNGQITKLSYYDWDKKSHDLLGKNYILAAHAIESPKLLLQSANEYFPQGLANRSDQVGRNLMDHPIQLSSCLVPENIHPYRAPHQTSGLMGFRDGPFRRETTAFYTAIQNDGFSWPKRAPDSDVDKALSLGLKGKSLKLHLNDTLNRQLVLCGMSEQLPNPNNRIQLSSDQFDYYGLPRPEIHYSFGSQERNSLAKLREVHEAIFRQLKATEIDHPSTIFSSSHIIGTLKMGIDPKTSVVNPHCQTHEHPNLFIAGSGVFPTSGTANPTLTLSALALRLAEYVTHTSTPHLSA